MTLNLKQKLGLLADATDTPEHIRKHLRDAIAVLKAAERERRDAVAIAITAAATERARVEAEHERDEALAREAVLREGLAQAAAWFREYEAGHFAKGTDSGNDKAARNGQRAEACEAAFSTPSPSAEAMVEVVRAAEQVNIGAALLFVLGLDRGPLLALRGALTRYKEATNAE